jgi:hypothetical protein
MSEFQFDCPSLSFNLATNDCISPETSTSNDKWFKLKHELHEASCSDLENKENGTTNGQCDDVAPKQPACGTSKVARVVPTISSGLNSAGVSKPVLVSTATTGSRKKQAPVPIIRPHSSRVGISSAPTAGDISRPKASRVPVSSAQGTGRQLGARPDSGQVSSRQMAAPPTAAVSSSTIPSAGSIKRPRDAVVSKLSSSAKLVPAVASSSGGSLNRSCDDDIMAMLKNHNKQTAACSHTYEPAMHSVRDVRKWEKSCGRMWSDLKSAEERTKANSEIDAMKKAALAQAAP